MAIIPVLYSGDLSSTLGRGSRLEKLSNVCSIQCRGDYYRDRSPWITPWITPQAPVYPHFKDTVTREEFNRLKEELKKVLKAAKIFDEATGQEDCELDDKVAVIKKAAELLGVDLEDIFNK